MGFDDAPETQQSRAPDPDRLLLYVFAPSGTTSTPAPREGKLTLGRADDNDIVITDVEASRAHAELRFTRDAVRLVDLGSSNGTQVDGQRLTAKVAVPIKVGQVFTIGGTVFSLRPFVDVAPPEATTLALIDPAMTEIDALIERVARTDVSVLILGPTGAGKELVANAVHARSPRASGPFLKVNCAAFSESMVESELFGHEKGAFTGADVERPGLFLSAQGGSVLLDEVGELPPRIQAKLLRVLENREVVRVGGTQPRRIDVRFLAATHRELRDDIDGGAFRADLYHRLNGITLRVPALRDRPRDIIPLAELFLRRATERFAAAEPQLTSAAREKLAGYGWPGNVRELKNTIERAVILARGNVIDADAILIEAAPVVRAPVNVVPGKIDVDQVRAALEQCGGSQTKAAEMIGISRRTLTNYLNKFALPRPRKS